jgi:hypothetical protein
MATSLQAGFGLVVNMTLRYVTSVPMPEQEPLHLDNAAATAREPRSLHCTLAPTFNGPECLKRQGFFTIKVQKTWPYY